MESWSNELFRQETLGQETLGQEGQEALGQEAGGSDSRSVSTCWGSSALEQELLFNIINGLMFNEVPYDVLVGWPRKYLFNG